jgi:hypothetical protein
MIKLEELKIGDKVYCVCSDGFSWHGGLTIHKELLMLDAMPNPFEAVICEGSIEVLTRSHEKYLFRTLEETENKLKELQLITAKELLNSNKFKTSSIEIYQKENQTFGCSGIELL